MRPHTVVIIGAGFSGTATAVQLVRQASSPLRIVLVNKSGRMARGLAYGTRSPAHLLNVPAGNMSALPDEPHNFLDYCRWADPAVQPHSFVPRALYGAYLDALLNTAESHHSVQLERMVGEVLDIARAGTDVIVSLDDNRHIACDEVILAFGHFAPGHVLPGTELEALGSRYLADPWADDFSETLPQAGKILLVGAGLTALDILTSLHKRGYEGQVVCLSRRGLMPLSHRREGAQAGTVNGAALTSDMGQSLRRQLRVLRTATAAAMTRGEDWRDTIGALRQHTPSLWRRLTIADRRRFLRHVRPYWDVLRHRCAPEALDVAQSMLAGGRLQFIAGRLRAARLDPVDGAVDATLQLRGATGTVATRFDAVVNCTGPSSNLRRSGVPLLERLMEKGRVCADPLELGLVVDENYAVLDQNGVAQPWLRYIGPLLKARDWEAIAVPELRVHAQRLATSLLTQRAGNRQVHAAAQDERCDV
jgi:uncharacterized NAD(P)/FAD-binding protein YdhS